MWKIGNALPTHYYPSECLYFIKITEEGTLELVTPSTNRIKIEKKKADCNLLLYIKVLQNDNRKSKSDNFNCWIFSPPKKPQAEKCNMIPQTEINTLQAFGNIKKNP